MTSYLIVAHQTAESEDLIDHARRMADRHPEAEFTLLVPATPVQSLLGWEEDNTTNIAERKAASARERLSKAGVNVIDARVGDADPYLAIDDELRRVPDYAGILVGTLPAGVSRWLRMDLISRVRRLVGDMEVTHVVAPAPERAAT
jgi:hypothetical protein